jgi:predicted unusual protein kinase regulating ubiquinone biosynthesis (AarF/ABC1/UbiB family)
LPEDYDTAEFMPLMTKILTVGLVESDSDLRKRTRKLTEISNELNEVFFRYPFSVPPFFAPVTRMLCPLEGISLTGDPEFDIFQASAPYARRQALAVLGVNTFRKMTKNGNMAGR